jgi:uncharacterized protein DUF1918
VSVKIGDRVTVEAERTSQTARHGVIEEVLQETPPRFRVQWDDGHESILSPAAGALRVEPKERKRAARGRVPKSRR